MSKQKVSDTNVTVVPADFPYEQGRELSDRCLTWNVCEELAAHLAGECAQVKAKADRSERPVDILLVCYRAVEARGWGEPPQLRWVLRRVAELLNWPTPDVARLP